MLCLVLLGIGLAGQCLTGLIVGRGLLGAPFFVPNHRLKHPTLVELTGLGIVLGIGFTSCVLFLWSFVGGQVGRLPSFALALPGFAVGSRLIVRGLGQREQGQIGTSHASESRNEFSALQRICQFWIAVWFAAALAQTLLTPQRFWDERAIFAIKGAVLFEDQTIHSPDLAEVDFVQGHSRYPLLLPMAEQNVYALLGHVDDRLAKVIPVLLYLGMVLTTVGVLLRHLSRDQAWMWGAIMASIPALMPHEYGFLCAQADAPVACFHAVAIAYLWDGLTGLCSGCVCPEKPSDRAAAFGAIAASGVCAGLAAFTKDEGLAFFMVDSAVLVLITLIAFVKASMGRFSTLPSSSHSNSGQLAFQTLVATAVFVGLAALVLIPWYLHRRGLPNANEMNYFGRMAITELIHRLNILAWTVPHLAHRMFWEWREWGFQWWLMAIAIVLFPKRTFKIGQVALLLDVTGALLALIVAGMLAPIRLEEHIGGSSHRFLMQIAPVAVLFAALQFSPQGNEDHNQ